MSDHPVFWVGNRQPSISDTITVGGTPVDLTGKTVRFKAREVGSDPLLVDAPVSNTLDTTGFVRYDWSAADIAEPDGILAAERAVLVWWEVTTGSKKQDVNEALIAIRAHGPLEGSYVELEAFKSSKELAGTNFADEDASDALVAASRGIDAAFGRRFYLDADATQVRYFNGDPESDTLTIDDLVDFTSLKTDSDGDGVYDTVWTEGTDFILEPRNAPADDKPYTMIRVLNAGSYRFPDPASYPNAIELTGQFGWSAVPAAVRTLTKLIAARLVKRTREAPFGVVALGLDGATARATQYVSDPDYKFLVESIGKRRKLFV